MAASELVFKTAVELARLIRERELSCIEVMRAHIEQIERVNPKVNAVCTLVTESALKQAEALDKVGVQGGSPRSRSGGAKGASVSPLLGLPVGVKDLQATAGIRTTYGSRIYKDFVPEDDSLIVQRYKAAGAIVIGKTNTPEFGAGSHTFNEVFGKTLNPYDLTKTCGGSSGGSAVGLACGLFPVATGSDLGGSLRNPAAWNNVVGIRPSIGRIPRRPNALGWNSLSVDGPMGRTVADVALQMSIAAGPDSAAPVSFDDDPAMFAQRMEWDAQAGRPVDVLRQVRGVRRRRRIRIAWSRDLGRYPIDPAVTSVVDGQRKVFESLGCEVEDASPDLSDADEIFQVYRAYAFAQQHERHLSEHRDLMKQTVVWNTEQGLKLSALDMARAEEKRTRLYERAVSFFEMYDFLVLPTTSVPPFPVDQEYVTEINGVKLKTYIDWFAICYAISVTGFPAISVPAGFTGPLKAKRPTPAPRARSLLKEPAVTGRTSGLPVGLQIVGGPRQDLAVLQIAHAYEQSTHIGEMRPGRA